MNNIIIYTVIVILGLFIVPIIEFICGYFVGWIIKITIGSWIASGLALININIPLDKYPLFFATLTVIGQFFKTIPPVNNNRTTNYFKNKEKNRGH